MQCYQKSSNFLKQCKYDLPEHMVGIWSLNYTKMINWLTRNARPELDQSGCRVG